MKQGGLELGDLASIFEHATIAIFLVRVGDDGSFSFDTVNPAAEKILSATREQVRGRPLPQYVPAAIAQKMAANYRRCIAEAKPISYEETLFDPRDGERVFYTTLIPIRNAAGTIDRILGQAQEITEQKRIERELRASEEKFGKAFSASPLAIGVTELSTARILEVNDGFERTFETTRQESLGRTLLELGCWEDPSERSRMISSCPIL